MPLIVPVDEEEREINIDDGVDTSLASRGNDLFILLNCGRRSLVSGTKNNIVVCVC